MLITLTIIVACFSVVFAVFTKTQFSDNNTEGNVTLAEDSNSTKYIEIPLDSNVLNANITLRGYNIGQYANYSKVGTSGGNNPTFSQSGNAIDEDLTTRGQCTGDGATDDFHAGCYINQSFYGSINSTLELIFERNWDAFFEDDTSNLELWNYSGNKYERVWSGALGAGNKSFKIISNDFISNNPIDSIWWIAPFDNAVPHNTYYYVYESIIHNVSNMSGLYLEIGTPDASYEWNYTGEYNNTSETTSNLSSAINSALNGGACDCTGCSINFPNCTIPYLFHADQPGKLEYSDSNVVWYDAIAPSYSGIAINNSAPRINENVTINITAVDYSGLSSVTLSWSCGTGSMANSTIIYSSENNHSISFNETIGIADNSCQYKFYLNDSSNNLNTTSTYTLTLGNPSITNNNLCDSYALDLTADGTNYGETSEGFDTGESTKYTFYPISTARQQILLMRYTRLDGSANVYIDNAGSQIHIGNVPADASGSGEWNTKAFHVNYSHISTPLYINITAGTNTETLYVDWLVLADTVNDSDMIVSENTFVVMYSNVSGNANDYRGRVWNHNDALQGYYYDANYTNVISTEKETNRVFVYQVGDVSGNYTYVIDSNSTGTWADGTNKTMEVDNVDPVINSVTTTLNVLTNRPYNISVNVTEKNDLEVNVSVNDSSFTEFDLTEYSTNLWWNSTLLTYSTANIKRLTVTAGDVVKHTDTYSFNVRASSVSSSSATRDHNISMTYSIYVNVSDTATRHNLSLRASIEINTSGDAFIDYYNQSYRILDARPRNIIIHNDSNSLNGSFSDFTQDLEWITEPFNNTNESNIIFNNSVFYTLNNSYEVEWENTGIGNLRLFHVNPINLNTTYPISVFLRVPLRFNYSGSNHSVNLYECTTGINWGAATCGGYTEITDEFYNQSNLKYHDYYDGSNYPTINITGNDTNKDTIAIKVNVSQERMFKIDLDSSTAETTWTAPSSGSSETSTAGGSSGGSDDKKTNVTTVIEEEKVVKETGLFADIKNFFNVFFAFIGEVSDDFFDNFRALNFSDPQTFGIAMGIVILVTGTILLTSQVNKPTGVGRSRGGYV